MLKIAINGFGRIGRMVFQASLEHKDVEVVAVNDLTDTETLAYLLKYDSVHPQFKGEIKAKNNSLIVNGKELKVFAEKDPKNLPWKDLDIDVVCESTGFFATKEGASQHLTAGAKKVLVSAPCKCKTEEDFVKTIVIGVNEHIIEKDDLVLSNGSCTTNCLAPIVKVLNDNFGVKKGFLTTIHSYTSTQKLVDAPSKKDPRRGRAAAVNMIPTTTGAAKAVTMVIPELKDKLTGYAIRVPTPDGSLTDFVCELNKEVTVEEINKLFKNVSEHHLKGILEYTEDPIVSHDIISNPHSCIFDSKLTTILEGNFVKVFAWYDNEWGYSCRMVELMKKMK